MVKKKKKSDKRYEMLREHLENLDYQGFIHSVWSFELAFPLKLSKHLHCGVYRFPLAFLDIKLQAKFSISVGQI